jgi:hypothetical protein
VSPDIHCGFTTSHEEETIKKRFSVLAQSEKVLEKD